MTDDTPKPADEAALPHGHAPESLPEPEPVPAIEHEPVEHAPIEHAPVEHAPIEHESLAEAGPHHADAPATAAAEEPYPASLHVPPVMPPAPSATAVPVPERSNRGVLAAIVILMLIVLFGGYWLYSNSHGSTQEVAALQDQLNQVQARLKAVEDRPAPAPPPNLAPLEQRLAALENKPTPAPVDAAARQQVATLSGRVDGLAARVEQVGTQTQAQVQADAANTAKLDSTVTALSGRVDAQAKASGEITALAGQQALTARLLAAAASLQSGKPLGAIPGAPPALARFATQAPPTEAALRLSFDAAADQAHQAGMAPPPDTPFLSRMLERAQSAVTVRKGDRVLVGDAASGVLEQARVQLDAGDLAGAVAALGQLTGAAAQAMAPWMAQAQSLLDARAALITAGHS